MAALPSLCRHAEASGTLGSPTHGIFSLQKGARFNAAVAQNSVDFQRVEQGFGVEFLYITIINGIVEYSQYSSIGTIREFFSSLEAKLFALRAVPGRATTTSHPCQVGFESLSGMQHTALQKLPPVVLSVGSSPSCLAAVNDRHG